MKANELRIGNLVGYGALHTGIGRDAKHFYTVKELGETVMFFNESNVGEYYKDVEPIPLTEEWLVKFGFEGDSLTGLYVKYKLLHFEIWHDCKNNTFLVDNIKNKKIFLTAIHQLQNLYFALTNEELPYETTR